MVSLRETIASDESFPRTVFVYMGTLEQAETFFGKWYPEALGIGDPKQRLYRSFKIGIGSIMQFFRTAVWKAYWNNRSFGVGAPVGNTMRNPAALLVHNKQILLKQTSAKHFGDQVDIEAVKARLQSSPIKTRP